MKIKLSMIKFIKNRLTISQTVFFLCALFHLNPVFSQKQPGYHVLIGTYTKGKSKGIQVYSFDSKTGKMTFEKEVPLSNPSYLCLSPDNTKVYAVSEDNGKDGTVSAYKFNTTTGELTLLNTKSSEGIAPCYVATDKSGKYVFVANYMSGTIAAYRLLPDGSLSNSPQILTNKGSSSNKVRQEHAHAHSTVISPDNKYLFTADLGTDKEMSYKLDTSNHSTPLSAANTPFYQAVSGSGPRHLIFSNSGRFAYLIQELTATIVTFRYANGKLSPIQTSNMIAKGVNGQAGAADIHLSYDGKFLYGTNRGTFNDITGFSVNQHTGMLAYAGKISSFGKTPRNFAISPEGNFLLVANQNSDDVYVVPRDKKTGKLSPFIQKLEIGAPVCIKLVKIP